MKIFQTFVATSLLEKRFTFAQWQENQDKQDKKLHGWSSTNTALIDKL